MKTAKKQTKPKNVNNSYFSTEKQAIHKAKTFGELYNAGSPLVDVGIPTPSPDEKENTLLKEWLQVINMLRQKYRILRNEASREHPNVHLLSVPSRNADLTDILDCCTEAARLLSSNLTGQSKTNIPDYKALNLAKVPISKLIQQSESHTLEFKEIPECNTQQNRKNNDVLFPPLKTIAGFLNAEGGILLIGVDNSGKIVGIEPYLNTMEQGNNDTFEQQIRNCLRDRFEPYPIGKVKVSFKKFMEGTVCRIDVQADKEPVNLDNKIYVRDGNTTQLLKGRRLTDWIQQRRLLTALPSGK